jgi:glycosyltransferase involved in cell wall biosynthesis
MDASTITKPSGYAAVERVLYVISRRNTFTSIDRKALEERYDVVEYYQPGFRPRPVELWRKLRRCDVVFGWFAAWHTLAALTLARLLGKPSVLVIGGFDTASLPEIGYGSQQGGFRRARVRWTVSRASRLITNSDYSLGEIERNLDLDPVRVTVVHHGLPDRFADMAEDKQPERMALSVGAVYEVNLERKGHLPFVRAAALLPEIEFVLAGRWWDDAVERLRAEAGPNVELTGYLEDETLDAYFRRAAVYVQASRHEGFGISLAEAMLAGCVPVATSAGALPEVVGDTGVTISEPTPERIAEGVRQALELGPAAGLRARARIRERFPYEMRRDGICAEVDKALQRA